MADIFSADPLINTEELPITLNDLVGEGQKYQTPDDLAKAYANLNTFAETLKRENADARAKADRLEAERNNQPNGKNEQLPNGDNQQVTPPTPKEQVDLRSQIREEFNSLNEQQRATANMELAAAKMVEQYGDPVKANEALRQRADELRVSVDWLRDSASKSPEAFYATMGLTGGSSHSTPSPNSDVIRRGGVETRNYEYFDKIRREDSRLFYSRAIQTEMLNQARKMGSDFYAR